MRKIIVIIQWVLLMSLFPLMGQAQESTSGGGLQLGLRTTASMFNSTGNFGRGVGGQFRLQLSQALNTDWFADYFTENLNNLGRRTDAHIGWSVVFYTRYEGKFQPFLVAGHCFDYTKITTFAVSGLNIFPQTKERWSSAVQAGVGGQWNISKLLNFTLQTQYMLHLGKDIHVHETTSSDIKYLAIEEHSGSSLEGHLLVTFAFNIKIAELW